MGNLPQACNFCNCTEPKKGSSQSKTTIKIDLNSSKLPINESFLYSVNGQQGQLENSTLITRSNFGINTHVMTQQTSISPILASAITKPNNNLQIKKGNHFKVPNNLPSDNRRLSLTISSISHIGSFEKKNFKSAREEEANSDNIETILSKMKKAYKCLPKKEMSDSEFGLMNNSPISHKNSTIMVGEKFLLNPIEEINVPFTDKQLRLIRNLLIQEEMIISQMDEATINLILNTITFIQTKENVTLYSMENATDNILYIINKGKLCYELDGQQFFLKKYECIGTKALKKNSKKSCKLFTTQRCQIFCLPIEKYKTIIQDFLDKDKEEKIEILKQNFFFNFLDNKSIASLAKASSKRRFDIRKEIISEGTCPQSVFLIVEGDVMCVKNDKIFHTLKQNEIFGDISIFSSTSSAFSYIVEAESLLLEIPYDNLFALLGEQPIKSLMFGIFTSAIKKCEFLNKHLTGDRLASVFKCFKLSYLKEGIISNFKKKKIFIPISGFLMKNKRDVKEGESNFKNKEKTIHNAQQHVIQILPDNEYLNKGDFFLNSIITYKDDGSIILSNEGVVLQAYWNDIMKNIFAFNNKKILMFELINLIKSVNICKHLSELKIFLLADSSKYHRYKENSVILKRGPSSNQLYIIKNGEVKIAISNTTIEVKILKEKMHFGNITTEDLDDKTTEVVKNFDFIAKGIVDCIVIEKEDYVEIVENYNNNIFRPLSDLFKTKAQSIALNSLYFVKELGFGTYGKVYLVHDTKRFYAMKTADIQVMYGNKVLAQYYLNEKSIMLSMNHPFIVGLVNTYKTSELIFFLMEYVEGVSLREYITNRDKVLRNLKEASFFGGIMFIVLNYLQKMRIIHRDLKPENLMIETNGYLKVIDFGIAKDLSGKDSTHTLIGTPHYMAPEIILGKRYSFAADYWSVGIILYELFYGKIPFGVNVVDSNKVFAEITEKKLAFPSDPKNNDFNLLIKNLLYKNPNKRISSFAQVKSHVFFKDLDFEELSEKRMKPLYCPEKKINEKDLENTTDSFYSTVINNLFTSSIEVNSVAEKLSREMSSKSNNDYLSDF